MAQEAAVHMSQSHQRLNTTPAAGALEQHGSVEAAAHFLLEAPRRQGKLEGRL